MDKKLCRICAKLIANENKSLQLFESKHNHILQKLQQLTGLRLSNITNLPKWMCIHCQRSLEKAYSFRQNVLKVQAYFKAELNRSMFKIEAEKIDIVAIKNENDFIDHKNIINFEKSAPDRFVKETILTEVEAVEKDCNQLDATYLSRDINENFSKSKRLQDDDTIPQSQTQNLLQNPENNKDEINNNKLKMFVCDQCGNHFYLRHHFLVHLKRHSGDKQYACEICPHKCFTNSELTRHMRKHTGERPFACKFCFRKFSDYSTRIKHERTHTNERPYACAHCPKSFTNSYILKNHILTHTREKLFSCLICHKSFSRRTHLAVHNRSVKHKQAVENETSGKN